jgi:transposase
MAMPVQPKLIGIDVSKTTLDLCLDLNEPVQTLDNSPQSIRQWLSALGDSPACFALEPTNTFHLEFTLQAHQAGHTVYLIDGYRLNRYRDSVGQRAKTDASDARLLLRYLQRERDQLRPWTPPPAGCLTLQRLLRRRAQLVKARLALQQSLTGLQELKPLVQSLVRQMKQLDRLLQKQLQTALEQAGWKNDARRCQAIEGIGPITAAALTATFHRGAFRNSDAFIAFLGLDVRVRDSGQRKGRRKLSKKGDPQLRKVLYLAAMQASRTARWKPFYQRYLERGFSKVQALVILARKLARIAFALLKNQSEYQPMPNSHTCTET